MRMVHIPGGTLGMIALACALSAAHADDLKFNVCMGNGGGTSCEAPGTVRYTCAEYKAIGGGGAATPPALGQRLCRYFDAQGQQQQMPYSVAHIYSRSGGECGWTLFLVTCLTPK
jgi:hypothetical protein